METLQSYLEQWNSEFEEFHKDSIMKDGLSRKSGVMKNLIQILSNKFPEFPLKFIESFVQKRAFTRMRHIKRHYKKEESARSKKQKVDLTETV